MSGVSDFLSSTWGNLKVDLRNLIGGSDYTIGPPTAVDQLAAKFSPLAALSNATAPSTTLHYIGGKLVNAGSKGRRKAKSEKKTVKKATSSRVRGKKTSARSTRNKQNKKRKSQTHHNA